MIAAILLGLAYGVARLSARDTYNPIPDTEIVQ